MKIKNIEYSFNFDRKNEGKETNQGVIEAEISDPIICAILEDGNKLESELGFDTHFNKHLNEIENCLFIEGEEKGEMFSKKINNFESIYGKLCNVLFDIMTREHFNKTITRVEGIINEFNGFGE